VKRAPREAAQPAPQSPQRAQIEEVSFIRDFQPTGVAVSSTGRIFVNFPRWDPEHYCSVGEITSDMTLRKYPDDEWNSWQKGKDAKDRFVCVQSVYVDKNDYLWALDAGAPNFEKVVKDGPKLVKIATGNNKVSTVVYFDQQIAPDGSYLNDVRIDPAGEYAYITDSGLGAIIVVNLVSGEKRRLLAKHYSVKALKGYAPVIGGREWRLDSGEVPQINADGIALSPDGSWLYYHALTARALYRIRTEYLKDWSVAPQMVESKVEYVADTGATDGMETDKGGNLYLTALEKNAVIRMDADGKVTTVAADDRLQWPDSICITPDGTLYVTTSQIHLMPRFNNGVPRRTMPYRIFRLKIPEG